MSKDLKEVRILLLGESGVGKTSLILSLVSEQFIDEHDTSFELPARLESILIPPEVTLENVPGIIIDYSTREQSEEDLVNDIKRASVICLVYAMNDEESKQKLFSYWLPKINEHQDDEFKKPIVIVGNKCDMAESNILQDHFINKLLLKFTEIETCIECSAKTFKNISELFYYAQKSVLYPTVPIYNIDEKKLTPACCKSLVRIFKLNDHDNDGVLSDKELKEFQLKSFNIELHENTLNEVKRVIADKTPDGLDWNNNLTLSGFLQLNTLFIEKGRHETIWAILKKFGYDRYLNFSKDYTHPILNVQHNCTTELSPKGFEFLHYLFIKYDKDKDMCLNKNEKNDLFSVCPVCPWGNDVNNTVETDNSGNITLQGFLSQWVLTTYLDINKAIELLAYLGYNNYYQESQKSAFTITRSKLVDIEKKQTFRNTFLCYVYGKKGCGKTAFLQGFLGRDLTYQAMIPREDLSRWTCNAVLVQNVEKHLILKEINSSSDVEIHEAFPPDIVVLLYDLTDPNSFQFIADIFISIYKEKPIPCFIIGTKNDQTKIKQNFPISPKQFSEDYNLPPPHNFSASSAFLKTTDIYTKLATIAVMPKLYPMRNGFWRLFQKFISTNNNSNSGTRRIVSNNELQDGNNAPKVPFIDKMDSNIVQYTMIVAACVTLGIILMKIINK